MFENITKVLWIIAIILVLLSGFKIKFGKFNYEFIGIFEQILNHLNKS
ncbi:hypothetical protein [uncultured Clostridium sp.]|nr:hypothetical protein [uncultured Clostridium sp.]